MNDRLVWIDCEMTGLDTGKDALLEIAALVTDGELRRRLGEGARAFAERSFSWSASADRLRSLYERALGPPAAPEPALQDVRDRYAGHAPPRLGYGTVRDYVDSAERLPLLATARSTRHPPQTF